MDSVTILLLVLCAGVVALLIWFEIKWRRNEASKTVQHAGVQTLPKESQATVEANRDKRKAA